VARARRARERHDSVTQAIFSMTLHARTAQLSLLREGLDPNGPLGQSLAELLQLTQGALAEMRALIFELRPGALAEVGLGAALVKQAAAVSARVGIAIDVKAPEERIDVDPADEENLYRLAQEALHNAVKHAGARRIQMRVEVDARGRLLLEVADDGVGFDPAAVPPGHMGLVTMADRARQVGGTFQVQSAPGRGTTVRVVVPPAVETLEPNGRPAAASSSEQARMA
jgi:signal transduction histidine kinase